MDDLVLRFSKSISMKNYET